jgi:uncharacterized protein (UPF0332 family)
MIAGVTRDVLTDVYAIKAAENLASAASELVNRRFNASVNRAYYACFQAARALSLSEAFVRHVVEGT